MVENDLLLRAAARYDCFVGGVDCWDFLLVRPLMLVDS